MTATAQRETEQCSIKDSPLTRVRGCVGVQVSEREREREGEKVTTSCSPCRTVAWREDKREESRKDWCEGPIAKRSQVTV